MNAGGSGQEPHDASAVRLLPDPELADDRQDLAAIEIEIEIRRPRRNCAACGRKSDREVADGQERIHRGHAIAGPDPAKKRKRILPEDQAPVVVVRKAK